MNNAYVSPVMLKLSQYISEARDRPIPKEVAQRAKLHLIDTFAAMISGSELPPGKFAINFAKTYGGEKIATVAGSSDCTAIAKADLRLRVSSTFNPRTTAAKASSDCPRNSSSALRLPCAST